MVELKKSEWEEIKKVLSKYGIWHMVYSYDNCDEIMIDNILVVPQDEDEETKEVVTQCDTEAYDTLYLVTLCDDAIAIFDSLEKAKAFSMEHKYPNDYGISTMEINKEEYDVVYYWDYNPKTEEWEKSSWNNNRQGGKINE